MALNPTVLVRRAADRAVSPAHDRDSSRHQDRRRRARQDGPVAPRDRQRPPGRRARRDVRLVRLRARRAREVHGRHDLQRLRRDARARSTLDAVVDRDAVAHPRGDGPRRRSSAACTSSARSRSRSTPTDAAALAALAQRARAWSPRSATTTASSAPSARSSALLDAGAIGDGHPRPRRGLRPGRAQAQGRHLAQPQRRRAAAASTTTPPTRSTCSTGTSASRRGVGGTVLQADLLARDRRRGLQHALLRRRHERASSRSTGPTSRYRKMTTQITLWGTDGRIFADRQEFQVYLRDARRGPGRLRARLERPLHDRAHRAGRVLPARRGVQRPDRALRRARAGRAASTGVNDFASAAATDRVIAMMIADAGQGPATLGRAPMPRPRPAAAAPAAVPVAGAAARGQLERGRRPHDGPPAVRRQPVLRRQPHVGGEGARPGDALPGLDAVIDVLDAAYDEGVRTFMCTTHDRIAEICDHVRAEPGALRRTSPSTPACPTRTSTPTR